MPKEIEVVDSKLRDYVFYLSTGIGITFTLIVYIHSTFSTKASASIVDLKNGELRDKIEDRMNRFEDRFDKVEGLLRDILKEIKR